MPGTSSTSTWPSASSAIVTRRTVSSPPTTARPTAPRRSVQRRRPAVAWSPAAALSDTVSAMRGGSSDRAPVRPVVEAYSPSRRRVPRSRWRRRRPTPYRQSSRPSPGPSPSSEVIVSLPSLARIPAPPDPILGLAEAYRTDTRERKINLSSGVFVDETGTTPVLADGDRGRAPARRCRRDEALSPDRRRARLPGAGACPGPRRRPRGGHLRPRPRDADARRHGRAAGRGRPPAPDRAPARRCG